MAFLSSTRGGGKKVLLVPSLDDGPKVSLPLRAGCWLAGLQVIPGEHRRGVLDGAGGAGPL
jgi:hypothetical protein